MYLLQHSLHLHRDKIGIFFVIVIIITVIGAQIIHKYIIIVPRTTVQWRNCGWGIRVALDLFEGV